MTDRATVLEPRDGTELYRWADEGLTSDPSHNDIVQINAPDRPFSVVLEDEDGVEGWLVRLKQRRDDLDEGDRDAEHTETVGCVIVDDHDRAVGLAHRFAEDADRYARLPDHKGGVPDGG